MDSGEYFYNLEEDFVMLVWLVGICMVVLSPDPDILALMTPIEKIMGCMPFAVALLLSALWYWRDKRRISKAKLYAGSICDYNIESGNKAEWKALVRKYRCNVVVSVALNVLFCPIPLCWMEYFVECPNDLCWRDNVSQVFELFSIIKQNNKFFEAISNN